MGLILETSEQVREYLLTQNICNQDSLGEIQELTGGVSNRTFWIERVDNTAWVLKQAREKLKVDVDWFCSPERIQREALGMRWLEQLAPPDAITPMVFEDRENHLLVMQAVPHPHENWKTMLMRGELDFNAVEQFGRLLGNVHKKSREQANELSLVFDGRSYFEDLRLEPYYGYTASQVYKARDFLQSLISETRSIRQALVHGDYSPKNVLVHNGKLVLLDHEVIHWGDPAFDIGFSLTHFLSKALHLEPYRQRFVEGAKRYWEIYSATTDPALLASEWEARAVRHTLACMLARVAGRSKLEYLSNAERELQQSILTQLIHHLPATIPKYIENYMEQLHYHVNH